MSSLIDFYPRNVHRMTTGTKVHNQLEEKFQESATPATFDEVLEFSKTEKTVTREMFVISPEYGIRGFIDEIWMTPDEFVIIDDKPGNQAYGSTINQVRAYCLAFKNMINDKRKIVGALRQRGTDNIFWSEEFDEDAQKSIKFLIDRMDGLFKGEKQKIPTNAKAADSKATVYTIKTQHLFKLKYHIKNNEI